MLILVIMKVKNIHSIVCLVIFSLFANYAWAAEWIYFASSSARDSYYDKSTIREVDKKVIRVWIKQILNENEEKKSFSSLKGKNRAPDKLDLISYILKLSEIDCVNKKIRDSSTIIYDEKSSLLYSSPTGEIGNWSDILPNTAADKLKNILCEEDFAQKQVFNPNIKELAAPPKADVDELAANDKNLAQVNSKQSETIYIYEEKIRNLVNKWLNSWRAGDMKAYRSCYDESFESKNMKLDEWITYKTNIRNKSKNINIIIDNLKISTDGNNAKVMFTQTYTSSILIDKDLKTLELKKVGNEWKIYREIM